MTHVEYCLLRKIAKSSDITIHSLYPCCRLFERRSFLETDQLVLYLAELGYISCEGIHPGDSTVPPRSVITATALGVHALTEYRETIGVLIYTRVLSWISIGVALGTLFWNIYTDILAQKVIL
jgi:hypothetical protein